MRRVPVYVVGVLAVLAGLAGGCSTAPKGQAKQETLKESAQVTINRFMREKPSIKDDMQQAAGYAVYPSIGKGGAIVGGAYGRGVLYEHGQPTGFCDLSQGSVGFQLGGQTYAELILLQDDKALESFKNNKAELGANASAVALNKGLVEGNAKFTNGLAIYTLANGGLMGEASVGGQRFTYAPAESGLAAPVPANSNQPQPASSK